MTNTIDNPKQASATAGIISVKKTFINKQMVPPGGFVYVEPMSGVRFQHIVFDELLSRVRLHRLANGYPLPPGWQSDVETICCDLCPSPTAWQYVDETPQTEPRSITAGDVLNFLRFAANWLKEGAQLVDQKTATERAGVCASCPKNVSIEGCSVCVQLSQKVSGLLGDRVTGLEGGLKGCAVCGCSINAMVWFPIDSLQKGMNEQMNNQLPAWCWKKKEQ